MAVKTDLADDLRGHLALHDANEADSDRVLGLGALHTSKDRLVDDVVREPVAAGHVRGRVAELDDAGVDERAVLNDLKGDLLDDLGRREKVLATEASSGSRRGVRSCTFSGQQKKDINKTEVKGAM
jgi:hypothetical protein